MIIYAIFIVDQEGRVVFSEYYQSPRDLPNEILLSSALTSLQQFAKKVTKKDINLRSVIMDDYSIHIRNFHTHFVFRFTKG